ncbi:MAG: HYR domain-containing protein [Gaiellaceae bacterium]
MKKLVLIAALLAAASLAGAAGARADTSAGVSIYSEAGEGPAPPGLVSGGSVEGGGGGVASTAYGWPLAPPFPFTNPGSCAASGCAENHAGGTASVDEAAGTLKAAAAGSLLVGNAPDADFGGDANISSSAEIQDTITLSKAATVVLVGSVHGSLAADNNNTNQLNDPRAELDLALDFCCMRGGEGPVPIGGYDQTYTPLTHGSIGGVPGAGYSPTPVDDSFSVPVELPAGTTFFSGKLEASISMLIDGLPNTVLAQDALIDAGDTVQFEIDVPDDVVATSGSGLLKIVGGASADAEPPTTSASVAPQPGASGWSNAPETVTLTAAENVGVDHITYSATGAGAIPETTAAGTTVSIPVSAEGVTTLTYFATDEAGNAESPQTLVLRIDRTAPAIATPAGGVTADATAADGADVAYDVTAGDNLDPSPGLACGPASGSRLAIGTTTVSCTATDRAGNEATASFAVVVRGAADQIDRYLAAPDVRSLRATARAAAFAVSNGRDRAACGILGAYALQVRALVRTHRLASGDGSALLDAVARIGNVVGC